MKKLIFALSVLAVAAGCGEVKISDSVHHVRHEIAIDDLHAQIVSLCKDAYGTDVEVQKCIQDTLQSVMATLQTVELPK